MARLYARLHFWHRLLTVSTLMLMTCLAAPSLAASQAAPSSANGLDCTQMLANTAARNLDKGAVATAQKQLVALGFNPGEVDGLLGARTRAALTQYCASAKFAVANDLLVMLRNHATIHGKYQDWGQTLASRDFGKWADKEHDHAEIGRIKQSGNSSEVIAVLDRYQKRKEFVPMPKSDDDYLVSYVLTKDDFKQLKSREEVSVLIGKLLREAYTDKYEFETAIEKALKGVAEPGQYVELIEKYAKQQTSFRLTEDSFNDLKAANVPEYILQSLQGIKDLNYPDKAFDKAVEDELGKLADRAMEFKPQLVKLAGISPSGASLTEASLAKFAEVQKDDLLAAAILERLRKLQGIKYKNDQALAWAMKKVLMDVTAEINKSLPVIIDHAEEVSVYGLTAEQVQAVTGRIKESIVPQSYLELIANLEDVDYPEADLFSLALRAQVWRKIVGVIEQRGADRVDQALLDELTAKQVPSFILDQLSTLLGRKFANTGELREAVLNLQPGFQQLILDQARKTHPFDQTKSIQWSGESCNCVHDNLAGEVYGFYPYWLAGGKQQIDFSVLTRVGYYGLGFDDKGNIPHASRWSGQDTDFIQEARTYGSKVDLVIYRNEWSSWKGLSAGEKSGAFKSLAANIAGLLQIPLTNFSSKAKPYVSLGTYPRPIRGDGVTLYFKDYPEDPASVDAFIAFVADLSEKLGADGHNYFVNIMFRSSDIGSGIYEYEKLLKLINSIKGGNGTLNSLLLVLLQEPTSDDKKLLRIKVENNLHGEQRVKLLRNLTPVITYDGHAKDQLQDDVIYATDNFGGIGFWPQPVAAAGAKADNAISDTLHNYYLKVLSGDTLVTPTVCTFICPNRWAFRIAWDLFLLVLLASVAFRFVSCEWRNYFDKHFIHFIVLVVVPYVLLFMALLFCDPSWEKISKGNGILIQMIVGVIAYMIWSYHKNKRRANLP